MTIPFPCDSCIHFSGMGFIPFCKKKIVGNVNNKPIYEWCSIMRTLDGECGVDSKLYVKNDKVIRISPTIVYSGKHNIDNINKSSVNLDKINKSNKDNAIQLQQSLKKATVKASEKNASMESVKERECKRKSMQSNMQMEELATILAETA